MIKNLIFDWGGVLTKGTQKAGIIAFLKEKHNIIVDPKTMGQLMDKMDQNKSTFKEQVDEFNSLHHTHLTIDEMKEAYRKGINPDKEITDYIKNLHYRVFMLSNNNHTTKSILEEEHKEMLNLFEKVYLSHEMNMHKPNKDIFEFVIKDSGLKAEECLFIDDKEKNVKAAEEVGMKGVIYEDIESLTSIIEN